MKRLLLVWLLGALLASANAWGQPGTPEWQQTLTVGQGHAWLSELAADTLGNVYVAGCFTGTAQFGGTNLTGSAPDHDQVYLAKWNDASQQYRWVLPLGTFHGIQIAALAVHGADIYLAGYFNQRLRLGDTTLLEANGHYFVVRLADEGHAGRVAWVRQVQVGGQDVRVKQLVARAGAVYLVGAFEQAAATTTEAARLAVYVAKLTCNGGGLAWGHPIASPRTVRNPALAVAGSRVFVAGEFERAAMLGPLRLTDDQAYSTLFIAKLLDTGPAATFVWAEPLGGREGTSIGVLAAAGDSVYIAGESIERVRFGHDQQVVGHGQATFLLKLRDTGFAPKLVWRWQLNSTSSSYISQLTLHGSFLYLAGLFNGTSIFGSRLITATMPLDNYLARIRDDGTSSYCDWVQRIGGKSKVGLGTNHINALAVASSGALYVAATLQSTATLGNQPLLRQVPMSFNDYLLRFCLAR